MPQACSIVKAVLAKKLWVHLCLYMCRWNDPPSSVTINMQLADCQAALSRELALIQGPPGTGKTFVGVQLVKALLANTQGNSKGPAALGPGQPEPATQPLPQGPHIGPVLIVCFTNHALDQFLEGLLEAGLTDMVRVGGR